MASKQKIIKFINDNLAGGVEIQRVNETDYIKFDFLPYKIREFVHNQEDYDETKMLNLARECQCGYAFFYEEKHFFDLLKRMPEDLLEK